MTLQLVKHKEKEKCNEDCGDRYVKWSWMVAILITLIVVTGKIVSATATATTENRKDITTLNGRVDKVENILDKKYDRIIDLLEKK